MKQIDLSTWSRKPLFESYRNTDFPYIILGARVDVSSLLSKCREEHSSFYFSLVHLATRTADSIENFHYRFRGSQVYRIDQSTPVLTHMQPGDEIFMMLEGDPSLSRSDFCRDLREKAEHTSPGQRLDCGDRLDIISFSCVPWVDYTHVIRTITRFGEDCNPKITWGKYETEQGRATVNLSVQVHHGLMDGYHVGMFYEKLQQRLFQEF